jgi:hypothetical protein
MRALQSSRNAIVIIASYASYCPFISSLWVIFKHFKKGACILGAMTPDVEERKDLRI